MDNKTTRLLFIGNSATYVHDVPETLAKLATEAGFPTEAVRITKGGYTLSQHADSSSDHGKEVLDLIKQGFDVVFLQDNGNCIADDEKRSASKNACKTLDAEIKKNGCTNPPHCRQILYQLSHQHRFCPLSLAYSVSELILASDLSAHPSSL